MAHRELRRSLLPLVLLATLFLAATMFARGSAPPQSSSSEGQQVGKVLSVRKVLRNRYFFSRYPRIHYYLLYFAVRASDQTYCSEYETPVLDEIDDLFSAKDKDVECKRQRKYTIDKSLGCVLRENMIVRQSFVDVSTQRESMLLPRC
jgi:hypothetical protein